MKNSDNELFSSNIKEEVFTQGFENFKENQNEGEQLFFEENLLDEHSGFNQINKQNKQYRSVHNILDDPNIMKSDLLSVLASPQGRRFLRRIFRACGVFDYTPIGDTALYAWHEGRRSIGLIVYHSVFELGANFINQLLIEDRNNI